MDDHSDLIQDYEITIESMRREILILYDRLNEPLEKSQAQEEYEKYENTLEIYRQDVEGYTADLIEEKKRQMSIQAEEAWAKSNSPE